MVVTQLEEKQVDNALTLFVGECTRSTLMKFMNVSRIFHSMPVPRILTSSDVRSFDPG